MLRLLLTSFWHWSSSFGFIFSGFQAHPLREKATKKRISNAHTRFSPKRARPEKESQFNAGNLDTVRRSGAQTCAYLHWRASESSLLMQHKRCPISNWRWPLVGYIKLICSICTTGPVLQVKSGQVLAQIFSLLFWRLKRVRFGARARAGWCLDEL